MQISHCKFQLFYKLETLRSRYDVNGYALSLQD